MGFWDVLAIAGATIAVLGVIAALAGVIWLLLAVERGIRSARDSLHLPAAAADFDTPASSPEECGPASDTKVVSLGREVASVIDPVSRFKRAVSEGFKSAKEAPTGPSSTSPRPKVGIQANGANPVRQKHVSGDLRNDLSAPGAVAPHPAAPDRGGYYLPPSVLLHDSNALEPVSGCLACKAIRRYLAQVRAWHGIRL